MASAMQRLASRLVGHPEPDDLRAALADAFDDPSLELVYWNDDRPAGSTRAARRCDRPANGRAGA